MRTLLDTRVPASICRLILASTALLSLAACQESKKPGAPQEMAWASSALERNPTLEIVATDMHAGVFTVRDRRTGEVYAVTLNEIAAAPIAQLSAPAPAAVARTPGESVAGVSSSAPEATSQSAPASQTAQPGIEPVDASMPVAEGQEYTIERTDGQVKVSGPGLSIVSGESAPPVSAKGEPGQRTVDPIICEGRRMMHLDGREIYVDGDAITARGGCELFITNSRIVASATGVVVRDAVVHIANSYVEGGSASLDAEGDAKVYLRGSTLQGMSRRDALAMVEDQGGNRGLPAH